MIPGTTNPSTSKNTETQLLLTSKKQELQPPVNKGLGSILFFHYSINIQDRRLLSFYIEQSCANCANHVFKISYLDKFILGTAAFLIKQIGPQTPSILVLIASSIILIASTMLVIEDVAMEPSHIYMLLFSQLSCFCCTPQFVWALLQAGTIESFWTTNPTLVQWVLDPEKLINTNPSTLCLSLKPCSSYA